LDKSEIIVKILLDIIGINVPIRKVVAVPQPQPSIPDEKKAQKPQNSSKPKHNENLAFKTNFRYPVAVNLRKSNIELMIYDDEKEINRVCKKVHPKDQEKILEDEKVYNLIAALTFLKCSHFFPDESNIVCLDEAELNEGLSIGVKGKEIVKKLETQATVPKGKAPEVEEFETTDNRFLWIDSVKEEDLVLNKIMITSLKATSISQVKYSELNQTIANIFCENEESKVLIIVPSVKLKMRYEKQILERKKGKFEERIVFLTPEDNLQGLLNCHVFIHETIIDSKTKIVASQIEDQFKRKQKEVFVWLDPTQVKIMRDKNPKQILIGSASTGKTILIQLKVLDLLKNDNSSKVLIILPNERLKLKYEKFFKNADVKTDNLKISSPSDNNWEVIFGNGQFPNVFIDEFSAINSRQNDFSKKLMHCLERLPEDNVLWVSVDFKQSLKNFQDDLTGQLEAIGMIKASKTHLLMVHRCTINVYNQYKDHCSLLTYVGHQLSGPECQTIELNGGHTVVETVKIWANSVENHIQAEKADGWNSRDICVILSNTDPYESIIFLMLFLELQSKPLDGIQLLFESESISLEWPVVIICSKYFSIFILYCAIFRKIQF
jgi:hypothetical protein